MNAAELIALWRSQVNDEIEPFLWSDLEAYTYLDQAQKWLVRRMRGIPDATTPEITRIEAIAPETKFVDLDPRVLRIRKVFRKDGQEVDVLNTENVVGFSRHTDYNLPRHFSLKDDPGSLVAVVTGMEKDKLRLVRPPQTEEELHLIVNRMPLETVKEVQEGDPMELEVDERHHFHLLSGMKALAYRKEDAETFDRGRAQEFEAVFGRYAENARLEQERREHRPRAVQYGGL